jgi:hypothetical protein
MKYFLFFDFFNRFLFENLPVNPLTDGFYKRGIGAIGLVAGRFQRLLYLYDRLQAGKSVSFTQQALILCSI